MPFNPGENELSAEKKSAVLVLILFINLILISSQIVLKNKQSLLQTVIANMIVPLQITFQKSSNFVSTELSRYFFLRDIFKKYQLLKKKDIDLKIENYSLKQQLRDLKVPGGVKGKFDRFIDRKSVV